MNDDKKEKIEKLICSVCKTETNHKSVWNAKYKYGDEEGDFWGTIEYELFQCLGCDAPVLRKMDYFSESIGRNSEGKLEIIPEITIWPKVNLQNLEIKNISNLPNNVKRIYRETIDAYNAELLTLCAAGIRAVIEAVCREEGIIKEDLEKKIDLLKEKGVITARLAEGLHQNRLIGNEALHELKLFGYFELKTAIELIETLLDNHYGSSERVSLLKHFLKNKKQLETNITNDEKK